MFGLEAVARKAHAPVIRSDYVTRKVSYKQRIFLSPIIQRATVVRDYTTKRSVAPCKVERASIMSGGVTALDHISVFRFDSEEKIVLNDRSADRELRDELKKSQSVAHALTPPGWTSRDTRDFVRVASQWNSRVARVYAHYRSNSSAAELTTSGSAVLIDDAKLITAQHVVEPSFVDARTASTFTLSRIVAQFRPHTQLEQAAAAHLSVVHVDSVLSRRLAQTCGVKSYPVQDTRREWEGGSGDLAVLSIDAPSSGSADLDRRLRMELPIDTRPLAVGDPVLCVGTPASLNPEEYFAPVNSGVPLNVAQWMFFGMEERVASVGRVTGPVLDDASVGIPYAAQTSGGMSGGGMFTTRGLVGMNLGATYRPLVQNLFSRIPASVRSLLRSSS